MRGISSTDGAVHLAGERKQFQQPACGVMMALVGQSVVGTIISSIMAIFMKNKKQLNTARP